jgi:hypothetical protein
MNTEEKCSRTITLNAFQALEIATCDFKNALRFRYTPHAPDVPCVLLYRERMLLPNTEYTLYANACVLKTFTGCTIEILALPRGAYVTVHDAIPLKETLWCHVDKNRINGHNILVLADDVEKNHIIAQEICVNVARAQQGSVYLRQLDALRCMNLGHLPNGFMSILKMVAFPQTGLQELPLYDTCDALWEPVPIQASFIGTYTSTFREADILPLVRHMCKDTSYTNPSDVHVTCLPYELWTQMLGVEGWKRILSILKIDQIVYEKESTSLPHVCASEIPCIRIQESSFQPHSAEYKRLREVYIFNRLICRDSIYPDHPLLPNDSRFQPRDAFSLTIPYDPQQWYRMAPPSTSNGSWYTALNSPLPRPPVFLKGQMVCIVQKDNMECCVGFVRIEGWTDKNIQVLSSFGAHMPHAVVFILDTSSTLRTS